MPRIAFVGAGSVEFTKNLLGDILSFPELADAEIALHDISQERLEVGEADGALHRQGSWRRHPGSRPTSTAGALWTAQIT